MTIYRLTPWAAQQMTDELRERIAAAEPRDHLVTLGRSTSGWTCRILSPCREGVQAENYGAGSMDAAFAGAMRRLEAVRG